MTMVWVVPVTDEGGTERFVRGAADAQGTIRASFTDENGQRFTLLNVPDVSPPTGELRFTDHLGNTYGTPFQLLELLGPWQSAHRAAESFGILVLKYSLGSPGTVHATNTDVGASDTPVDGYWADVGVEFTGCEQRDFGGTNGYRISGEFVAVINAPLERGELELMNSVNAFEEFVGNTQIGDVVFGDTSHMAFHRGNSMWQVAVRCPFTYDFDEAPKGPSAATFGELTSYDVHAACRSFFAATVAAESLPVTYDNGASVPGTTKRADFNVLPGDAEQVDAGDFSSKRMSGVALATLMVKQGVALDDAWRMVDVIATAFRGATSGGVDFQTPEARSVGSVDGWWAIEIACPFFADQLR